MKPRLSFIILSLNVVKSTRGSISAKLADAQCGLMPERGNENISTTAVTKGANVSYAAFSATKRASTRF